MVRLLKSASIGFLGLIFGLIVLPIIMFYVFMTVAVLELWVFLKGMLALLSVGGNTLPTAPTSLGTQSSLPSGISEDNANPVPGNPGRHDNGLVMVGRKQGRIWAGED